MEIFLDHLKWSILNLFHLMEYNGWTVFGQYKDSAVLCLIFTIIHSELKQQNKDWNG